jgi:hypothetical protein
MNARSWLWLVGLLVLGYAGVKWMGGKRRRNPRAKRAPRPIVRWVVEWPIATGGWPGVRSFADEQEALDFKRTTKGATLKRVVHGKAGRR